MTIGEFAKIIKAYNIPDDVTMLSDSGWECDATNMDGIYYNEAENKLVFVQEGDVYDHHYYGKPGWKLIHGKLPHWMKGWIKCSDYIPDMGVDVLGTTNGGDIVKVARMTTYLNDVGWEWVLTDDAEGNGYDPDEIIAWTPLPEAYKEV